jgi:thymidylate synthase (FAD)
LLNAKYFIQGIFALDRIEDVKPLVVKLAETRLNADGVSQLLQHFSASDWRKQTQVRPRSDAELLIELAGRVCYKSFRAGLNPNISKITEDPFIYLQNILKSKHGSVLEHSSVTFAFLNVSRVFTHELVRHRAGTAISQESLRYVRPQEINLWLPPELKPVSQSFLAITEEIRSGYRELEAGFQWDKLSFEEKKRVTSAIRRILPDGIATNVIWTANHRTIRWVIEMRTAPSAEVEMRMVFDKVAEICIGDYPLLYSDFSVHRLDDGTDQYAPAFSKV